ncbi:hypothetical protein VNO80_25628 [Phaseolus coccineus]|uniref:Uncharacterized protein n=1 Tax=Phaseolus coccineus TaxID=3886 RepID=A0AAN9LV03_PHACN
MSRCGDAKIQGRGGPALVHQAAVPIHLYYDAEDNVRVAIVLLWAQGSGVERSRCCQVLSKVCWPWRNGCVGGEGLPNLELLQIGGNKLDSAASIVFNLGSRMERVVLLKWNVAKQYVKLI